VAADDTELTAGVHVDNPQYSNLIISSCALKMIALHPVFHHVGGFLVRTVVLIPKLWFCISVSFSELSRLGGNVQPL